MITLPLRSSWAIFIDVSVFGLGPGCRFAMGCSPAMSGGSAVRSNAVPARNPAPEKPTIL